MGIAVPVYWWLVDCNTYDQPANNKPACLIADTCIYSRLIYSSKTTHNLPLNHEGIYEMSASSWTTVTEIQQKRLTTNAKYELMLSRRNKT